MSIKPSEMSIQKLIRNLSLRLVFITLFYLFLYDVNATEVCTAAAAKVVSVQGIVELRRGKNSAWEQAQMETRICLGDQIRVRKHSRAAIRLMNESVLRLDQRTVITFPEVEENEIPTFMELLKGAIHFITRTPRPFNIQTPYLNAATEGTEFFIGIDEETHRVVRVSYSMKAVYRPKMIMAALHLMAKRQ